MKNKIIFMIILIISSVMILSACENNNDNSEFELSEKVSARFDEIFLAFNEKRFDDYVSYYRIDEDQKNMMLTGLKSGVENNYDTKYEIRNVVAFKGDDGEISATIIYYFISNFDGDSFIIEETMYYKLMEEDGKFFISSYESGPQRVID